MVRGARLPDRNATRDRRSSRAARSRVRDPRRLGRGQVALRRSTVAAPARPRRPGRVAADGSTAPVACRVPHAATAVAAAHCRRGPGCDRRPADLARRRQRSVPVDAGDRASPASRCGPRDVRPGDLFAALPGARVHGADFAGQALARGRRRRPHRPGRRSTAARAADAARAACTPSRARCSARSAAHGLRRPHAAARRHRRHRHQRQDHDRAPARGRARRGRAGRTGLIGTVGTRIAGEPRCPARSPRRRRPTCRRCSR